MSNALYVTMLGSFSIQSGQNTVDEHSNRMKKVWLLLAYLIYSRKRRVTQNDLLDVIRGADSGEVDDPAGRLKALLYRSRGMLDGLYEGAGHHLIQRQNGAYCWNSQAELILDAEEFDRLCKAAAAAATAEEKLELYRQAMPLYQGDFLPKLSMEPWVMPINAYYHQLYLSAANEALSLMENAACWAEAASLCAQALKIEPYSEELYRHLMRCRMEQGDRAGALLAYEQMTQLLFDTFGVMPSEESRQLYRKANRLVNDQTVAMDTVSEQLQETHAQGAMYCEYDFFRFLYQAQARAIARSGEVVHIALLSLYDCNRQALPRKSLDRAMDNLQDLLLQSLRKGDVVCRCSVSQMLIMLPQANYENSCAVCQRLIKAFYRQYPHSPAQVHYHVRLLEPKL